jgi:hypothetical protein
MHLPNTSRVSAERSCLICCSLIDDRYFSYVCYTPSDHMIMNELETTRKWQWPILKVFSMKWSNAWKGKKRLSVRIISTGVENWTRDLQSRCSVSLYLSFSTRHDTKVYSDTAMRVKGNTFCRWQFHTPAPSIRADLDNRDKQIVMLAGQLSPGNVYERPAVCLLQIELESIAGRSWIESWRQFITNCYSHRLQNCYSPNVS